MKRRMIRPWPGLAGKDRAGRGSLGPARSRSSLGGKSAAGRQAGPADRGPDKLKGLPGSLANQSGHRPSSSGPAGPVPARWGGWVLGWAPCSR